MFAYKPVMCAYKNNKNNTTASTVKLIKVPYK